jgi:hypothetical protein
MTVSLALSSSPAANPPSSSPWDLSIDTSKNIAVASHALSLAQDVACAIQVFQGELFYDIDQGIPYKDMALGQAYAPSVLTALLQKAALTVPGVVYAKAVVNSFNNRQISGTIDVTDVAGHTVIIKF